MAVTIEEVTAEVPRETPVPAEERGAAQATAAPEALTHQVQQQLVLQAERVRRQLAD